MAGETNFADANGLAKKVYDNSGVKDYFPASSILTRDIHWEDMAKTGESYSMSVVVQPPNGFTYVGSSGAVTALKQPRNMLIKQAVILPFELDMREQTSWSALSRLASENQGAFAQLQSTMQKAMKKAASIRQEVNILRGQKPLGTVAAVADAGSSRVTLTFTAATWAPGFWWAVGAGATFDAFTSTTKNNGSGPLILYGIDTANKKCTFTHSGTYSDQVAADDVLYFEGAWDGTTYTESPGVIKQASHTSGAGPVGLDVTTYPSFQGNTYDVGGGFSTEVAEGMVSQLRDRGAEGTIKCYLPNITYGEIANEVRANQAISISYNPNRQKFGQSGFIQESKDVGPIEYVNHPFLQWGEVLFLDTEDCCRGGSSDLTPTLPGTDSEKLWRLVDGYNAAELALFSDQFVLLKAPPHAMYGTGVTHT
jgi:hypothetical protein